MYVVYWMIVCQIQFPPSLCTFSRFQHFSSAYFCLPWPALQQQQRQHVPFQQSNQCGSTTPTESASTHKKEWVKSTETLVLITDCWCWCWWGWYLVRWIPNVGHALSAGTSHCLEKVFFIKRLLLTTFWQLHLTINDDGNNQNKFVKCYQQIRTQGKRLM